MTEHDETLERMIETLQEPVDIDPDLDRRVMQAIAAPATGLRSLLTPRWTLRISPVGALAAAAAIAAIILAVPVFTGGEPDVAAVPTVSESPAVPHVVMQFVLVAPQAKQVSLVGDFNDWNTSATRLVRQEGNGVWWVTVPLEPGRYRYAFVVDGTTWRVDPATPAVDDEFGRQNSVITIGGA